MPYSLIEHISQSVASHEYIAMFSAYFDASRSNKDRVVTTAGFVSRLHKWKRFEVEWLKLLAESETGVTMFHMTDFVASKQGWESWKGKDHTERRRIYANKLVACIKKHTNKGFSTSLRKQDYDALNSEYCVAEELGPPYALCGFGCLGRLAFWAERKGVATNQILCIFEDGDVGFGRLRILAEKEGFNVIPQKKKDVRQFDSCDFAAWKARAIIDDHVYRKTDEQRDQKARELMHKSFDDLDIIIHDNNWLTKDALVGTCKALKISKRKTV